METRVALIGVIVENQGSVEKMNRILHQYGEFIIGRMGVPYRDKGLSIISLVVDAPMNTISSISGKLGMLPGVSSKTIYSKTNQVRTEREDKNNEKSITNLDGAGHDGGTCRMRENLPDNC